MTDILISGYYGFKNSGDDALLLSIIRELRNKKSDIKITVLSKNPQETESIYNVKAIKRDNIISLIKASLTCKMLLLGGGTLIQDGTSTKSLLYYLFIIKILQLFGKKVMLYSNGIGPLKEENHKITKKILDKVDLITLRDPVSMTELEKIGITKPKIILTADSAFCIEREIDFDINEYLKKHEMSEDLEYFCVSVRNYDKLCCDFKENIAKTCDYIFEKYGYYPVFLPFQKEKDTKITNEIKSMMKYQASIIDTEVDISALLGFIKNSKLVIGMRLHSLIYSAICCVPLVGLVYDPKVSGFMEYIGQKMYFDAEGFDFKSLINTVDDIFNNYDEIKTELAKNLENMKSLSKKNAQLAIKLLEE